MRFANFAFCKWLCFAFRCFFLSWDAQNGIKYANTAKCVPLIFCKWQRALLYGLTIYLVIRAFLFILFISFRFVSFRSLVYITIIINRNFEINTLCNSNGKDIKTNLDWKFSRNTMNKEQQDMHVTRADICFVHLE